MGYKQLKDNQYGMVALITTMILMIVISLIVLGFSQVTRRNQQQALDAQLSSQAFYAAESGVNLAKSELRANAAYTKGSCGKDSASAHLNDYAVGVNVDITCVLVSPVNNLIFDNIGAASKVSLIQPESGGIDTIVINWESTSSGNVTGCNVVGTPLPQAAGWGCNQPLLRVDLVPLPSSMDLNALRDQQYTAFLYPDVNGTDNTSWAASAGSAGRGNFIKTKCSSATDTDKVRKCMVKVSLPVGNPARYGIRMMSLYGDSRVELHAKSGGSQPGLKGAQVLVDSTARATDVLKRVQARVSTLNANVVPDFAIASNDLCKRYLVNTGNNTASVDNLGPATAACQL